jgi:hypothetical protein
MISNSYPCNVQRNHGPNPRKRRGYFRVILKYQPRPSAWRSIASFGGKHRQHFCKLNHAVHKNVGAQHGSLGPVFHTGPFQAKALFED